MYIPYRGDCTYVRYGQMGSTVLIVRIMYVRTLGEMRPPPWLVLNRSWLHCVLGGNAASRPKVAACGHCSHGQQD